MNRKIRIIVAASIVVLTVAAIGTGIVVAKSPAVWDRLLPFRMMGQTGNGWGMMGSVSHAEMMNGTTHAQMMGGTGPGGEYDSWMDQMHAWMSESGGMHDTVWKGLADTLGLTPDELNAQLASGKTIIQIAEAKGIPEEQLAQKLESLVRAGLDQAVAAKKITQEQADQMLKHMGSNYLWMLDHMSSGDQAGAGGCHQNNPAPGKATNS